MIGDRRNKEAAEKKAREKELLKVPIKKEDVDFIVRSIRLSLALSSTVSIQYFTKVSHMHAFQIKEMEISRSVAEQTLREHRGNVVEALITLTN